MPDLPEMKPVQSSNMKAVGYDPQTKAMYIDFHNARYRVDQVEPEHHAALMAADSKGSHFHTNFRAPGKHKITKVER